MASLDHMPFDQFAEIIMKLDVLSRDSCAAVNKEWQQVMSFLKTVNRNIACTPDHVPSSLFGAMELNSNNTQFGTHNIYSGRSYRGRLPGLKGQNRWFGAGEGWLVASQQGSSGSSGYALVNAITNEHTLLTRNYTMPGGLPQRCYFTKIVLCQTPKHKDGFLLVGLPSFGQTKVDYLRKNDTTWSLLDEFRSDTTERCEDAVFYEGKLYILTSGNNLFSFLLLDNLKFGEAVCLISVNLPRSNQHWQEKYLVLNDGQLLSIARFNKTRGYNNKPDRISLATCSINGPFTWKGVSKIGNFAIFLSVSSNAVVVPVGCQSSVQANSLYFAEPISFQKNSDGNLSNLGVYDISQRMYCHVAYNPRLHFPVWLRPSLAQVNEAEGAEGAEGVEGAEGAEH